MSKIMPSNLWECRGKFSYPNRSEALAVRQSKGDFSVNVYHCSACHGFHLGRSPTRRKFMRTVR